MNYNFATLDKFKKYFLQHINNKRSKYFDKIFEAYSDKTYDATISNYNGAIESELDYIKKHPEIYKKPPPPTDPNMYLINLK